MLVIGFGWGKPVQFNPYGLKVRPKTAMLLVSGAGPLSNFVAAFLLALPIRLDMVPYVNVFSRGIFNIETTDEYIGTFLSAAGLPQHHPRRVQPDSNSPARRIQGRRRPSARGSVGRVREARAIRPPALMVIIGLSLFTGFNLLSDIMGPTASWLLERFTGVG